jgi:hypothetical protein
MGIREVETVAILRLRFLGDPLRRCVLFMPPGKSLRVTAAVSDTRTSVMHPSFPNVGIASGLLNRTPPHG